MGKNLTLKKPWSKKDENFLKENHGKMKIGEIANKLQRTKSSIYSHAHKLKLPERKEEQLNINEIDVTALEEITTAEKTVIENNSLAFTILSLENAYKEKCKENKQLKEAINRLNDSFLEFRKLIK